MQSRFFFSLPRMLFSIFLSSSSEFRVTSFANGIGLVSLFLFLKRLHTVNFAFTIFQTRMISFLLSLSFSTFPFSSFSSLGCHFYIFLFFTTRFFTERKKNASLTSTRIPRHLAFHFIDAKAYNT